MQNFIKNHTPALIIWALIVAIAIIAMPNVSQLTRDKGQVTLPRTAESQIAANLQKKANGNKSVRTYAAVFSNGNKKLTAAQTQKINRAVKKLRNSHSVKTLTITAPGDSAETKKQLISKDQTTQMAEITMKKTGLVDTQVKALRKTLKVSGITTYVTGSDALNNDFSTVSEKGIQKMEIIAVIFIFIVLIIVFRSPVVPLVSLLGVGVSFITSLSIVMNLAARFNFPISNFTQVFMVVVLFGIGTDYNILLFDNFKESLGAGLSPQEATREARRHGGRTILYSGISVLIGFSVLALAKFSFYQSAVGVAIGILVLLPVLLTLNMFFMATLGEKLFWPSKISSTQAESRLWHGLSKAAIAQPAIVLGVVAIVGGGFALTMNGELNFNNADEVPSTYQAKRGYNVIEQHFPKGMTAPTTIYIKTKNKLTTPARLATVDQLTKYVRQEPGVKTVASVTEPGGTPVKKLYLRSQLQSITQGLATAQKGLNTIKTGLTSANTQLKAANLSSATSQVNTLASGSKSLASGLSTYASGVDSVSAGTSTLSSSLPALTSGMSTLSTSSKAIASGMTQLQTKLSGLQTESQQLLTMMTQLTGSSATSTATAAQLTQLTTAVNKLARGTTAVSNGLTTMNSQLPTLTSGVNTLNSATNQLAASSSTLNSGASSVASGASEVNTGVQTMSTKLKSMTKQVASLQDGLTSASAGLTSIASGDATMRQYLQQLQKSYIGDDFYIPQATINSTTFAPSLAAYTADHGKLTTITVVLKGDPNSAKASSQLKTITADVKAQLKHGALKNAEVAVGGTTSTDNDLRSLANSDFLRTAVIMLIGIGIALIVVTESVIEPLSILGTLLVAYVSARGITGWLSATFLGRPLLSWNTPFFSFIMLMALGVDYSIFLMVRFKDSKDIADLRERMLASASRIGAVVISAAVILSGTFAALIPSGVTTLIQVALVVIIGLVILVLILPMTLSAVISLTEWRTKRAHTTAK